MAAPVSRQRAPQGLRSFSPILSRFLASSPIRSLSRFSTWRLSCILSRLPAEVNFPQSLLPLRNIGTCAAPEIMDNVSYHGLSSYDGTGNPVEASGFTPNSHSGYNSAVNKQTFNHQSGFSVENSTYQHSSNWCHAYNNLGQGPHGFYQEKRSEYQQQGVASEYHPDSHLQLQQMNGPFKTGIAYPHSVMSGPANTGLLSTESLESGGANKYRGTIDELDEYCRAGKIEEAVEVLDLLGKHGTVVDLPRYLQLIQACGNASFLSQARIIHEHISRTMGNIGIDVNNKILDMYAKCGSMDDAMKLFETMPQRNLTSWDTVILGFANNGLGEEAIDSFTQFKKLGLRPDGCMFINVFFACGVIGAVDEGMLHFESMQKDFGIVPCVEHYVSIVNMLGQSGYLDEAFEFIEEMPIEPSADVWETLMNLCRVNGYLELGDCCAEIVDHLDSSKLTDQHKSGLLPTKASELASVGGRQTDSLLPAKNRIYQYRAGDRDHAEQLRWLAAHMKESGYIPDTRFALHDIDPESKEEALLVHSERIAVCQGLMTSQARKQLTIIKNLRCCVDCHNALKIISNLTGRKLIVRDAKRYHHFENGVCNCNDFW